MIKYPTAQDLAPLVAEATDNKTAEEFVALQLENIEAILIKDPRSYRSYGVFWWGVKALLAANGVTRFGEYVAPDIQVQLAHLSQAEKLCAAYANKITALEEGRLYSASHSYDSVDGDLVDYELDDLEMELLITNQQ